MVETMVASAIGLVVLVAVSSTFMAAQRMLHTAMAESELSLAMREMRDKLLFKASPDVSGSHYAGLLSGKNLNEGDVRSFSSVEMSAESVGSSLSAESPASMRLLVWSVGGRNMLINERTPDKDSHLRWLWPGALALSGCSGMSDLLSYDARNSDGSNVYRIYLDIGLEADVSRLDGTRIVRHERVSVPILGRLQPMRGQDGRY